MSTEIVLVRHGETEWNQSGRIQGQLDIALNANGRQQAGRLASRLATEQFDAIYSSDLQRAMQTATAVAERLGMEITTDPALRERHFGQLQGELRSEVAAADPVMWRQQQHDPDHAPPGGESGNRFADRSVGRLESIATAHPDERVLVVTHGGVLTSLLKRTFGLPCNNWRPFSFHNTSINIFHYLEGVWSLDLWGDAAHLASPKPAPGVEQ